MEKFSLIVNPDGSVVHRLDETLKVLSDLGTKSIQRISEILWNEDRQKFYIRMVLGRLYGCPVKEPNQQGEIKFFDTYEEAVSYEKKFLEEGYLENQL